MIKRPKLIETRIWNLKISMAKIRKYIYIQEVILNNSYCQRLSERKNIRDHINKFFDIVDKLKNMNVDINESLLSIIAI